MSKFRYTVSNRAVRQEGTIESSSFEVAVRQLHKHVEIRHGDVLEIGLRGFPPARYECLANIGSGEPIWRAA